MNNSTKVVSVVNDYEKSIAPFNFAHPHRACEDPAPLNKRTSTSTNEEDLNTTWDDEGCEKK